MTDETSSLLFERMDLCYVLDCSRCSATTSSHSTHPVVAVNEFHEDGWRARERPNRNKEALAEVMDTSGWPDTRIYVTCPDCEKDLQPKD